MRVIENHKQLVEKGREVVRNAPQLYIDGDFEHDGKAGYGSPRSIGAVSPWGETFYRELQPSSDIWIESQHQFCEEHGLSRERLLEEGIPPAQAMEELTTWQAQLQETHQKEGAVFTAFNAGYDFAILDLEYATAKLNNPFGIAGFCLKSLAMTFAHEYDWKQTAKGKLPTELLPTGDFTHHALEDALYQQQIHFAMIGKLSTLGSIEGK